MLVGRIQLTEGPNVLGNLLEADNGQFEVPDTPFYSSEHSLESGKGGS